MHQTPWRLGPCGWPIELNGELNGTTRPFVSDVGPRCGGPGQRDPGASHRIGAPAWLAQHRPDVTANMISSPKRATDSTNGSRADWFPFYAGYSSRFVEDVCAYLKLPERARLLDPWLGSGTTAEVAVAHGYRIRGFDINPAMLVVAKARTLASGSEHQLLDMLERVATLYAGSVAATRAGADERDGLRQWLVGESAARLRLLERAVARTCGLAASGLAPVRWRHLERASPAAAALYVALFRVFRRCLRGFETSNPTWIKVPDETERIELSSGALIHQFEREVGFLLRELRKESQHVPRAPRGACSIRRASSLHLPMAAETVDAIISSPPYCTRIDYVQATLPELALLGCHKRTWLRRLREEMIGTPTLRGHKVGMSKAWGDTCAAFLGSVGSHHSKASATYYLRYFRQYFASAHKSLREIRRVLRRGGHCVLVVQDSYYKEIRNDLPTIYIEMAEPLGLHLTQRLDFRVRQTLAAINSRAKAHRAASNAIESVLIFGKDAGISSRG